MPARVTAALLVAACAVVWGHMAWRTIVGPPASPEYIVASGDRGLAAAEFEAKNLYLRRVIAITHRPIHAWLQVIARDRLRVYVNGEPLAGGDRDGLPIAALVDLAPLLRIGTNVLAVTARQASSESPPVVSVEGEYWSAGGQVWRIQPDREWRSATRFEHQWVSPEFQDRHWTVARLVPMSLRSGVNIPPGVLTMPTRASWITPIAPPASDSARIAIRRRFDVDGRPARAWLRLTASSAYRVAMNGVLLDEREDYLGTDQPAPPVRRSYDVTSTVRQGPNVLALLLTRTGRPPQLLADLEVTDGGGSRVYVGSDETWLSRTPAPADWLEADIGDPTAWQPSRVESGDVGFPWWAVPHQHVPLSLPLSVTASRLAREAALVLVVGVLVWVVCRRIERRLGYVTYLALVPATLALTIPIVATYDPRISADIVFRSWWLGLSVLSVPLQWFLLERVPLFERWHVAALSKRASREAVLVVGLIAVALWVRIDGIAAEPLQWDEVEHYEYTLGFFERGFPSRVVHRDLPVAYVHTSELMFVPSAMASLFFDDPRYVMRVPAVCWSVASVFLIYLVGRRMFTPAAGLIAAAILALSPVCIAMSTFGRYFAQLQFFTLLVVYALWLAIRGAGPLNRRALAATALSFTAMYLTWEGSAFLAVGMALAAIIHRHRRVRTIAAEPAVWLSVLAVAIAVAIQHSHVVLQQTQFLWYGTSLSDLRIRPMWDYPTFRPWFYFWASSWSLDALVPTLAVAAAVLLSARHVCRTQLRFLLAIYLTTCLFTASLLPAMAWRYAHHLIPMPVLLGSAALMALTRSLVRLARGARGRGWTGSYARGVAALVSVALVIAGSGTAFDLRAMSWFRVEGADASAFKFPNLEGPSRYVRDRLQPGDVILATDPFQVKHLMGLAGDPAAPSFFWPASVLQLSATLDDHRPVPLDRRDGTPAIVDLPTLRNLFARHQRIWYIVQPDRHENQNVPEVTSFLRQHMDVVYEDFEAAVLLRDQNHRRAVVRYEDEEALGLDFRNRSNFPPEPRFPEIRD